MNWKRSLCEGLVVGLLFLACVIGLQVSFLITQTSESLTRTEENLSGEIRRQGAIFEKTQAELLRTVSKAGSDVSRTSAIIGLEAVRLRVDANRHLAGALDLAEKRSDQALSIATQELNIVNPILAHTAEEFAGAGHEAEVLQHQVNETLPLFLDCDHNADCLFNRYVGTMRGLEQMSVAMGKAAPQLAETSVRNSQNLESITDEAHGVLTDVHTLTSRVVKPKSRFGKLWEVIKLGGYALAKYFL